MSNGVKLINYLQPQGEYLTFFSELDSDLKIGEKVFIIGGNYDNIHYTDKVDSGFDPFNEFANGYTILSIDNTNNSNAVTLNIKYGLSKFNVQGTDTTVFNPKPVYKTEKELLINPNQISEAYMSKTYFKRGEFNGGVFDGGIFGEFNIKGNPGNKPWEKDKFVEILEKEENLDLSDFDYSTLSEPSINNKAKFNNKFTTENPARFSNGVFLGGEFHWGEWSNKYDSNKKGKRQTLNDAGTPFDPLDQSRFNIQNFSDDNNGLGFSYLVSGNIGKIYEGSHNLTLSSYAGTSFMNLNDYMPYPLKKIAESVFDFKLEVKIKNNINVNILEISKIDVDNKRIYFADNIEIFTGVNNYGTAGSFISRQYVFIDSDTFDLEFYVKNNEESTGIKNTIDGAVLLQPDIFSGTLNNVWVQGGDVWNCEFRKGRISSYYSRLNWWDGVFNGTKEFSFAENVRWHNGTFVDGNWKGDFVVPIKNQNISKTNNTLETNVFYIDIPAKYKHLFAINEKVFISYIKKSIGTGYFQNFTDLPTQYPMNFAEFQLLDILETSELDNLLQVRLELGGAVDFFTEDVSLQYAKVSQSYFTKGVWKDGIWESGLREVSNKRVIDVSYESSTSGINKYLTLQMNNVDGIYMGQKVEVSNIEIVRQIEVGILDGIGSYPSDDRGTSGQILTFTEPLNQTLTVLGIDYFNTSLFLKFEDLNDLPIDENIYVKDEKKILDIRKKLSYNEKTELTEAVWENGTFKSGAWDGGIFRDGLFTSKLYFDITNTESQSVFQSGYWKNGVLENSTFLSGVWESGTVNSGIFTNLFKNDSTNSSTLYDDGDTVFIDGTIDNVEWRRGLMLDAVVNDGKIINGGIENIRFDKGQYTNGLGVYVNSITSNRSGRQLTDKRFVDLSAPSVIYVDGDGWVQLDQPSYFQKEYNVIFQDMDRFPNPLNGEMFNILERDIYGTKVKIDYSTSGDNPLYLKKEFANLEPILSIDNITDFAQLSEDIYWLADSGNNRILVLNTVTKKVEVLGKIALQEDIYGFQKIKFLTVASKAAIDDILVNAYVVDTTTIDTLRKISLDSDMNPLEISNYVMPLNTSETIIDLKAVSEGSVEETVLCLTNQNRILYTSTKTDILKAFSLDNYLVNASKIVALRKKNTNSIDLLVLNNNTISHLVLDYISSSDTYSIRSTSPVVITGMEFVLNTIRTFASKYEGNGLSIFIVIDNADTNSDVYKFSYNEFFDSSANTNLLLNEIALTYPIYRSKMSNDNNFLVSTLSHMGVPLILSKSNLEKTTTGYANPFSQINLLINDASSSGYSYWIYDDLSNRLIYTDEATKNKYNANLDVDTLTTATEVFEILKMTKGESKSIVYSIQRSEDTGYSIRKTERNKLDVQNSQIFKFSDVSVIYDIVYVDKLFILLKTTNGEFKIVTLNQTQSNANTSLLPYFGSSITLPNVANFYNSASFDIIKTSTNYLGVLTASSSNNSVSDILELSINDTAVSTKKIYTNISTTIKDVLIKYSESVNTTGATDVYALFFATSDGIIKTISSKEVGGFHAWTIFGTNVYYTKDGVKEMYLNSNGSKIVSSIGGQFTVVEPTYVTNLSGNYKEENNIPVCFNIATVSGSDFLVALSNDRLVEMGTSGTFPLDVTLISSNFSLGRFEQDSTSGTPSPYDFVLSNPRSMVKSQNNRFFFIDDAYVSGTTKQAIRFYGYELPSPNYDLVYNGVSVLTDIIYDLCYLNDSSQDRVYYALKSGSNTIFKYFIASNPTITTEIAAPHTINRVVKKFSIIDPNNLMVVLTDDTEKLYYGSSGALTSTITINTTDITDVALIKQSGDIYLYILKNERISFIKYAGGIFDPNTTGDIPSLGVSIITENHTNSNLLYFETENFEAHKISGLSTPNETFVSLGDFAFNPEQTNPQQIDSNYIFLYNSPSSNPKGVIKQPMVFNSVQLNSQIDDASTGSFVKLVTIDNNTAYAMFNETTKNRIYKYDFSLGEGSVVPITNPVTPEYRSGVHDADSAVITFSPVDMTHYKGKLLGLFRYSSSGSATNYYDIFEYNTDKNLFENASSYNWLYPRDTNNRLMPLNNNGSQSSETFPSGKNLRIIFKSELAPKFYSGKSDGFDYVSMYFGSSGAANFLKLVNVNTVTPLISNQYDDLLVKINLPSFNKNAETITSVTITPDPLVGTGSAVASTFGVTSIMIGADTVSFADNEIWAKFLNTSEFVNLTASTYGVRVVTKMKNSHISSLSYPTGITGYKIFENQGNNIKIKASKPIETTYADTGYFDLTHPATGMWSIQEVIGSSSSSVIQLISPVSVTSTDFPALKIESNIGESLIILDALDTLNNSYDFDDVTKGYKVTDTGKNSNQTLSPYLTSRVLYKTILNKGVIFNNIGTPKTAHFVASKWNNNLFLGTWSEPDYFDNEIIQDLSVFVDGIFEGDFYNGYFLGGKFRNNSKYASNLVKGHFISDSSNINIESGNIQSDYRYDILNMKWSDNQLVVKSEGLFLENENYRNYPISKIGKSSWVKIPNIFNKIEFSVIEIWNGKIKVDGKNEITFVVEKPNLLFTAFNDCVEEFLRNKEIFVHAFEYAEELFGMFEVIDLFEKDDLVYITTHSNFNNFDPDGKYVPINKPIISFNEYFKVQNAVTYSEKGKSYTEFTFELFSPFLSDDLSYGFIEKAHLKDSVELIKDGDWKGYIQIPNYSQLFNTTLSKSLNSFEGNFTSPLMNLLVSDIQSTGVGDASKIQIDLPLDERVLAHDIMVENSQIQSSTLRSDVYTENSIFLSGVLYAGARTTPWLNVDDRGFSNGESRIGDIDNPYVFYGDNSQIIDVFFEGYEYVWIQLENIIFDVEQYRWITLRGFTGSKSQLIGSTRSKVFRIEEVKDNLIKIRNPFVYYNDYGGNGTSFNKDRLSIANQTMYLKGLEGDNVKCSSSDAKQLGNFDFTNALSTVQTTGNWYYKTETATNLYTVAQNGDNGLKASFVSITPPKLYKTIYQKYDFKLFTSYDFEVSYDTFNSVNTFVTLEISIDGVLLVNETITTTGSSGHTKTFSYTQLEEKEVEVSLRIIGSNNGIANLVVNNIKITNSPEDEAKVFNYGWASPSAFNGGDFYGEFNSIWNAGNFRGGEFNGQWFGSEENRAWNGKVLMESRRTGDLFTVLTHLEDLVIDGENAGNVSVEIGDLIYLKFASFFNNGEIVETFDAHYGIVSLGTDGKAIFEFTTDENIPNDKYVVNITTYRNDYLGTNRMVNDYNFNVKINDSVTTYKHMDWILDETLSNGTNGVLGFDGSNHIIINDYVSIARKENGEFSIDLLFKYDDSSTIQPLISFQDSSSGLAGIKIYAKDDKLFLKYKDSDTGIESQKEISTEGFMTNIFWSHLVISFTDSNVYTKFSVLQSATFNLSQTNFGILSNVNIDYTSYDICFIGKMLDLESDKSITNYTFKGYMDEIRIWNKNLYNTPNVIFDPATGKLNKFTNEYIPELLAYWNADKPKTLDSGNYYPEEENYFLLNGNNNIVLQDDLLGADFSYGRNNLFLEMDIFPERYVDIENSRGEYKLMTLEEIRPLPNNVVTKYYLELILKIKDNNSFNFLIREKVTSNSSTPKDLVYPLDNNDLDYSKDILFDNSKFDFYKSYNLILTDNQLFINASLLGEYNLSNRNLFKYTVDTRIILGKYEFATINGGISIDSTPGLLGFIKNINLWENKKYVDEYGVYRILSAENTDVFNGSSILTSNDFLKSGSSGLLNIPYFNTDGSNQWDTYIYSGDNNYTAPVSTIENLNIDYLTTSLPDNTWLSGTDFQYLATGNSVINTNSSLINPRNYLLTNDINDINSIIILKNMENFKFFNKKISDSVGNAKLNVTASGYLFFETLFSIDNNLNYPLFDYVDDDTSPEYSQVSTTDAIMFNNILDIRSYKDGFVKWADRDDEFVIEFFGKSTQFDNNVYEEKHISTSISSVLFSMYAIRIDKINSTVMVYIRRDGESEDQKILGLRRSDGYWSYINDTSGLINYYKQPGGADFIIGASSTSGIKTSNNTEYIVFVPRFNIEDTTSDFVSYLARKDYYQLNELFGLNVFKQFNANSISQYQIVEDTTVTPAILKKYMTRFPEYVSLTLSDYTNPAKDFNEQYVIKSQHYLFNGVSSETDILVSRDSFFYGGNFNSNVWHNGIFVNGNINVDNFIWKYGIKHNGTIQGGSDLINYAHWLGGYHLGDNDNSFVKNVVWLRGLFDGGQWEKGHWLALDLNNSYVDDDWSIWNGGEWYSKVDNFTEPRIINLFMDGDNGTFGNTNTSNWNLTTFSTVTRQVVSGLSTAKVTNVSTSVSYSTPVESFRGSSKIGVGRNTVYTITATVKINPANSGGVRISAIGAPDKVIENVLNVGYNSSSSVLYYYDVQKSNDFYQLVAESNILATIQHTFNSGNNDYIQIGAFNYSNNSTLFEYNITNISMIGVDTSVQSFDPYVIKNHDSVWHGGVWKSDLEQTGEIDENGDPIYFEHTWQSANTKSYTVNNNQILTLPEVGAVWLGGLWLRGKFEGGIFANGFWHSLECEASTSGYEYEVLMGQTYNSTSSVFYSGQMMNSIWYGGTVSNNGDKLDVLFGELLNLDSIRTNVNDFTWTHDDYAFKKSDFTNAYSPEILGRETFTGYHYDPLNDGTEKKALEIEVNRTRRQFNSDGIMSVYWKRGDFGKGVFQFSHWDSLDLNNDKQSIISEKESKNYSIFRNGAIYSSTWENGLFYANSSRDRYPFLESDEPNSLFYYSRWKKGYWKANGLKNIDDINKPFYSSLDTTDDISITNAMFSRSLWDAGVFEGGVMDLSIWRSGISSSSGLEYKNTIIDLVTTTNSNNAVFYIDGVSGTNTDFAFSTSSLAQGLDFLSNDDTFLTSLENSQYRYVGGVDNLASIFVNGHMRGTVWHGGVWQRGMFQHKDFQVKNQVDFDFFDNDLSSNPQLDPYQLGIWNRGLWLSGYFSYYNDKLVSYDNPTDTSYLYYNGDKTTPKAGRRSLFMSLDAALVTDNTTVLGINSVNYTNIINVANYNENDVNNYASFFMRRMLKERTDVSGTNSLVPIKPYFSIMNGSVTNGVIYQDIKFTNTDDHEDRYVLSLTSTVSNMYNKTAINDTYKVLNNVAGDDKAFIKDFAYSKSSVDRFQIPYNSSPVTYDTGAWVFVNNNGAFDSGFLSNYNNGFPSPITPYPHIWRHNYDERTEYGAKIGDGTIVNGTNGLRGMSLTNDFTSNLQQVSIAQGAGLSWIPTELQGEPKYSGDGAGNGSEEELNLVIISFFSNTFNGNDGFDDYGTAGFETNI